MNDLIRFQPAQRLLTSQFAADIHGDAEGPCAKLALTAKFCDLPQDSKCGLLRRVACALAVTTEQAQAQPVPGVLKLAQERILRQAVPGLSLLDGGLVHVSQG